MTATGSPVRRRTRPAALIALLVVILALGASLTASAAGLGGVRAQGLGAATVSTKTLSSLDLYWTPQWHQGSWRMGEVKLASVADRGLRAGDTIDMTVHSGPNTCEVSHAVTAAEPSVSLAGAQFAGCAASDDATVAVSVTGVDGASAHSSIGELRGSLAAFSAALTRPDLTLSPETDTTVSGQQEQITAVHLDVPAASVSDVAGGFLVVVLPGTGQATGVIGTAAGTPVLAQAGSGGGVRITMTLDDPWPIPGSVELHAALSTPQHLTGAGGHGAITTATWSLEAEPVPEPPDPAVPVDNALEPARLSPGIEYAYTWQGAQTNGLDFCHEFTITNTTDAVVQDWAVQFDSSLPPLWGADPTLAVDLHGPLQTTEYDAGTGLWTIGGRGALPAGQSREYTYCATQIPPPEPDPALFDTTISAAGHDHDVAFTIEVTSTSPFYLPWRVEVDFADLVCPERLVDLNFSRVQAIPVEGSASRYVIEGNAGDTQLVSSDHSRTFEFARYNPRGPGWQLGCGEGQ